MSAVRNIGWLQFNLFNDLIPICLTKINVNTNLKRVYRRSCCFFNSTKNTFVSRWIGRGTSRVSPLIGRNKGALEEGVSTRAKGCY